MSSFALTIQRNGKSINRFTVESGSKVIGRSPKVDVVLDDHVISRRHARLTVEDGELVIEDLGSTNGVRVNGKKVTRATITDNDDVLLGTYVLVVSMHHSEDQLRETGALIPYEAAKDLYDRLTRPRARDPLAVLYQASQLLGAEEELTTLMDRAVKLVSEAVPARRVYLYTRSRETDVPQIHAEFESEDAFDEKVSMLIVDHVFDTRTAVLTTNPQDDPRFDSASAVVGQAVRAAMCVPLCARDETFGVIYADTNDDEAIFTSDEFELLTALGRVVAAAMDNVKLNEERIHQERLAAIGEAIAGLGHCMKNVLTGLRASQQFIDMVVSRSDWEHFGDGWSTLGSGLQQYENLVEDLLMYAGKSEPHKKVFGLRLFLDNIVEQVSAQAGQDGVEISLDCEVTCDVFADEQQLRRVVLNLVGNAIDACRGREKKEVEITGWSNPFGVYVDVSDTGEGISDDNLNKVFEAFYTTKGGGGTGLGLASSRRLVEQHGGRLTVESVVGRGSRFSAFFPHEGKEQKDDAADRTLEIEARSDPDYD